MFIRWLSYQIGHYLKTWREEKCYISFNPLSFLIKHQTYIVRETIDPNDQAANTKKMERK